MRMYDIIMKKRDGGELSKEEIEYFVYNYTKGNIPDYQASALLMAIYFKKMNKRETADLTMAMVNSGETIDLTSINGIKVDKHSTGGVGDKTSLVLGPMVAACEVPVAKMSGRGLGYTGGTIDKLESIKGFSVEIPMDKFIENVNTVGLSIVGQTGNLVPADKKIYALRDVTATVDNISLIASSIMSKKIASGTDAIVLDVKCGSGAFMKNKDDAFELGQEMVDIGTALNRKTVAVISDMDEPLGFAVGNVLEIIEVIETLKGNGPKDLVQLCLSLGSHMLILGGKAQNPYEAEKLLKNIIENGLALKKFKEFVMAQGGDPSFIDNTNLMPSAKYIYEVKSDKEGFVEKIIADEIGIASLMLGAGRETKESKIDFGVGIVLNKKVGDSVLKGEVLAKIYANTEDKIAPCNEKIINSFIISDKAIKNKKLIYGVVSDKGIERY